MRVWHTKRVGEGSRYRLFEDSHEYVENLGWGRSEVHWDRQPKNRHREEFAHDKLFRGTYYLAFVILLRATGSVQLAEEFARPAAWKWILFSVGRQGLTISERQVRRWIDDELANRKTFGLQSYATQ